MGYSEESRRCGETIFLCAATRLLRERDYSIGETNFTFPCPPHPRYCHGIGDEAADLVHVSWRPTKFQLASLLGEARILLNFFTLSRNAITHYQTN